MKKRRWGTKDKASGTPKSGNATPSNSGYPVDSSKPAPLRDRTNQAAMFALKLRRSEVAMCDAEVRYLENYDFSTFYVCGARVRCYTRFIFL